MGKISYLASYRCPEPERTLRVARALDGQDREGGFHLIAQGAFLAGQHRGTPDCNRKSNREICGKWCASRDSRFAGTGGLMHPGTRNFLPCLSPTQEAFGELRRCRFDTRNRAVGRNMDARMDLHNWEDLRLHATPRIPFPFPLHPRSVPRSAPDLLLHPCPS
jgi:hypothetical protein